MKPFRYVFAICLMVDIRSAMLLPPAYGLIFAILAGAFLVWLLDEYKVKQ